MSDQFFSVTLASNFESLQQSIPLLLKWNPGCNHSVICPAQDVSSLASLKENHSHVLLIVEDELLSLGRFRQIVQEFAGEYGDIGLVLHRAAWYYQQVLKLTLALEHTSAGKNAIMWDADTVPIRPIQFFDGDHSILYGSLSEFHLPYFRSCRKLFGRLPASFMAFTIQYFAITPAEGQDLARSFQDFCSRTPDMSRGEWVARVVLKAVLQGNQELTGSMISEQEVVGISNLLNNPVRQRPVCFLRWGLNGFLNPNQMAFLRRLGFWHVSYENADHLRGRQQTWSGLLPLVLRSWFRQQIYWRFLRRKAIDQI